MKRALGSDLDSMFLFYFLQSSPWHAQKALIIITMIIIIIINLYIITYYVVKIFPNETAILVYIKVIFLNIRHFF